LTRICKFDAQTRLQSGNRFYKAAISAHAAHFASLRASSLHMQMNMCVVGESPAAVTAFTQGHAVNMTVTQLIPKSRSPCPNGKQFSGHYFPTDSIIELFRIEAYRLPSTNTASVKGTDTRQKDHLRMNGTDLSRNSFGTSILPDSFACFMPGCL
jgi:hypothetical protein